MEKIGIQLIEVKVGGRRIRKKGRRKLRYREGKGVGTEAVNFVYFC